MLQFLQSLAGKKKNVDSGYVNPTVEAYMSELINNIIIYKESIFETPRFVCQNDGCDYFHYNNNNIISVNFISNIFTFESSPWTVLGHVGPES